MHLGHERVEHGREALPRDALAAAQMIEELPVERLTIRREPGLVDDVVEPDDLPHLPERPVRERLELGADVVREVRLHQVQEEEGRLVRPPVLREPLPRGVEHVMDRVLQPH
ncbi:MAG: hypothetical protein ACK56I_03305, partial [bacterium]